MVVAISGNYASITWKAPFANYSPITGYYVHIQSKAEEFVDATPHCSEVSSIPADKFNRPNVKVTQCQIELATLRSEFSLVYGD